MEREIWKRASTLRYLLLDFIFTDRLENPKKDLELSLTAVLQAQA